MSFFGRYQQGSSVPLWITTTNASGVPTAPDAAPTMDVHSSSGLVIGNVAIPILEPAATVGIFAGTIFLGELYPVDHYWVQFRWTTGGGTHLGSSLHAFEVIPGGDPSGQVIALAWFPIPGTNYYVQQRANGSTYRGKNPRV